MNSKPFFIVLGTVSLLATGPLTFAAGDEAGGKSLAGGQATPVADINRDDTGRSMDQQNTTGDQPTDRQTQKKMKKKQQKEGARKTRQQGDNPSNPSDTGPGAAPAPSDTGNPGGGPGGGTGGGQ